MRFVNNWSQAIALAAGETWCELDLPNGTYRLTLADKISGATRWEIIEAGVDGGEAWLTRGLEGTEVQEWPESSVIYCAATAGTLTEMAARISQLEASSPGGGDGLTKGNFAELVPQGYMGNAADVDNGALMLFNRKSLGCLFYGGLGHYTALAPIYRAGTGPEVAFGEYQRWNLGVADCGHVYTVAETGVSPFIGIAAPPTKFGELNLSAPSFGPMYDERPAKSFELSLTLTAPTLGAGDIVRMEFSICGFSKIELEMDPVTRVWTANGQTLGTLGEYETAFSVSGFDEGSGYPETVSVTIDYNTISLPLSPDRYASSSGISLSTRTVAQQVFKLGRIGGHVVYADYD